VSTEREPNVDELLLAPGVEMDPWKRDSVWGAAAIRLSAAGVAGVIVGVILGAFWQAVLAVLTLAILGLLLLALEAVVERSSGSDS
jgi:F0F1-type ATP synthase assembly protein I